MSEGREQAAARLSQAHGAVRPEGRLLGFGDRALAPDVGRPERAAAVTVVNVLSAQIVDRQGRGGWGRQEGC